ncbi:hypothetical protein GF415_01180 [Candidatus Micrarchaeota archaeon]|nr:hypothetical protein [Candidatus Micrarchaeota archaeon]
MKKVFGIPLEKKKELMEILEKDPYEKGSFAMMGYKLKEGEQVGESGDMLYLYVSGEDEKIKGAGEKLGELKEDVPESTEKKIIELIAEEEEKAASGMGDIFG